MDEFDDEMDPELMGSESEEMDEYGEEEAREMSMMAPPKGENPETDYPGLPAYLRAVWLKQYGSLKMGRGLCVTTPSGKVVVTRGDEGFEYAPYTEDAKNLPHFTYNPKAAQ